MAALPAIGKYSDLGCTRQYSAISKKSGRIGVRENRCVKDFRLAVSDAEIAP